MSDTKANLRKMQLKAKQAAAKKKAADTPAADSGGVPADHFFNPTTGQYTSRELLRNNFETSPGKAALAGAAHGASFGFSDELSGGVGFLEGGKDMAKFRMEQARAAQEALKEDHPNITAGSEIGGAILPAISSAPLAIGKGLLGTVGRGFGIGAVEGALHGSGRGEGVADRAEKGGKDAILGALIGGALPIGVSAAKSGYRAIADPLAGLVNAGNSGRAKRAIAATLKKSGMSIDDIDSAVSTAAREGQPEFRTMDALGIPGQRRVSGLARAGGETGEDISEYLAQRQLDQGDRVGNFLSEGFDLQGTSAARTEAGLREGRKRAADAAYDAARGNAAPVDVRSAISVIDDRIGGMQGVDIAGDGIDARLSRFKKRLSAGKTPSGVDSIELSDFDRVLGVKQDVQDAIGAAVRAGRNNEARELGKLVSALDEALEASSDMYRAANDSFRESSRVIDAVGQGADMTRPGARAIDTVDTFRGMTPDQQAAARVGYGDKVLSKLEANASPTSNKAKPLQSTKAASEIDAIASDPELLKRRLARESQMWETQNRAMGGSRTADNLADIDATGRVASDVGGVARSLANLQFGDAIANAGRMVAPHMTGQNEGTRRLIAEALMSKNPKRALGPAMRSDAAAQIRQRVIEAIMRNAAREGAGLN